MWEAAQTLAPERLHQLGVARSHCLSEFKSEMRDATAAATGTLVPWVSQKPSKRYSWMKWIVMSTVPLSFCASTETRTYTKLAPVSANTLLSNMEAVTKAIEHNLAAYGCYDGPGRPRYPLLFMAPIMDGPDDKLHAEGHKRALEGFLPFVFGKTLDGCKFLVGDNCTVNMRLANLVMVPLVGCARRRLNLVVREFLALPSAPRGCT